LEWAYLLLITLDFTKYQAGTAVPALQQAVLERISVGLPPVVEQKRIVAKVDELMALCNRLEASRTAREAMRDRFAAASLARLDAPEPETFQDDARFAIYALPALTTRPNQIKQLRQTILNLAVRGRLVPQDAKDEPASDLFVRIQAEQTQQRASGLYRNSMSLPPIGESEEPFLLPNGWQWFRLRTLVFALGDGLHGTPEYSEGTDFYFINGNNLINGRIVIKPHTKTVSFQEMQKHKKLMTSHTVLVSINGTLGSVAFYENENVVLGKSACYFNLSTFVDKHFMRLVIESPYFVSYAVENATGTTIRNLGLKAMNYFPVPLPPLAEQRRIVAKVDELMALCDKLEATLTNGNDTRSRLLDALLAEALEPPEDAMPVEAPRVAVHG
jgi:type I restriction enzyme S subunit